MTYFGSNLSRGACEALALQRIPQDLRDREADLVETKWFEERRHHHVLSTYHYAHTYVMGGRAFCRQNNDSERADTLPVLTAPDIFTTRELNALVSARQAFDVIGCRYEWAFSWLVHRFTDRGWMSFPRPNQLYGEEILMDLRDAWKEECAIALQVPKDAYFRLASGAPLTQVQQEYVSWVLDQARNRSLDPWRPCSRLLKEGVLTPELVEAAFGGEVLRRALKEIGRPHP